MNNEFSRRSNLELYELEYSAKHAATKGYHTGLVNGKTVAYTNIATLNLAGERIHDPNAYKWPDKKTVAICVGYPEDNRRHRTFGDRFRAENMRISMNLIQA